MKRFLMILVAMMAFIGTVGIPPVSATDTNMNVRAARTWCQTLPSGSTMYRGDYVIDARNCDGASAYMVFQHDGNVVFYSYEPGTGGQFRARWATHTSGSAANRFVMQGDGNLVLYDTANRALWNSGTHGNPGAYVYVSYTGVEINNSQGLALRLYR